ncbi:MAG TPA: ribosome-associated translation inhibitor RaiA [Chitinophagaceae bacterium]|nr:ribosome-associated translation inhibitor RaiA [Chitinophagaceae bacterium]
MNLQLQTVRFEADESMRNHVQKRVDKLKRFHDRITDVEVYLKEENRPARGKVAEIKINVPGSSLFAKHESDIMQESIDKAYDSIVGQIKRYKQRATG